MYVAINCLKWFWTVEIKTPHSRKSKTLQCFVHATRVKLWLLRWILYVYLYLYLYLYFYMYLYKQEIHCNVLFTLPEQSCGSCIGSSICICICISIHVYLYSYMYLYKQDMHWNVFSRCQSKVVAPALDPQCVFVFVLLYVFV